MGQMASFRRIYLFCLLKKIRKYDIIIWNEMKTVSSAFMTYIIGYGVFQ